MTVPRRVLAVSPHLDDAVLSAGATLAELTADGLDVHVCTVFAGAPPEPLSPVARAFHANCGLIPDASAIAARIEEDQAAVGELGGAQAHHLGFLDAVYRRGTDGHWLCRHERAMFDDQPLDHDLHEAVAHEIRRLTDILTPDLVLTCAAIGEHIDHRLTESAVRDVVAETQTQTFLWEDLPYAIQRSAPPERPSVLRRPSPDSWTRKWRAIARYDSQIRMLWATDVDWRSELLAHAESRGKGRAYEAFFQGFSTARFPTDLQSATFESGRANGTVGDAQAALPITYRE